MAMVSARVDPENWIPDSLERAYGTSEASMARQLRFHSMDEMQASLALEAERVDAALAQERLR
jgi:hypothetical protein